MYIRKKKKYDAGVYWIPQLGKHVSTNPRFSKPQPYYWIPRLSKPQPYIRQSRSKSQQHMEDYGNARMV